MRTRTLLLGTAVVIAASAAALQPGRLGLDRFLPGPARAVAPAAAPFVMPVPVAAVIKRSIPIDLDYAARTESPRAITLQAKVSAYVTEQRVPDGADVKAGALLYRLDPRDFQATLDTANAAIERDSAALDYQRSNYHRGDELSKSGWLAKDSFDQRASTMRQAEAALVADRATARAAALNLDYTEIRAPFDGRLGRDQAAVGTLVSPSGTVLNTLVQLDPVYVTFNPSETDLVAIGKARGAGQVSGGRQVVPGADGPDAQRHADLRGQQCRPFHRHRDGAGHDRQSRPQSVAGPVRPHPRACARPARYTLLVPQTAIGSSQLGKYVYVLGAGDTVEQKLVTLGPTQDALICVLSGVTEGDRVITGNLQKIGPGMPVKPLEAPANAAG